MTFHCADGGFKNRSAGIAKRLSRVQPRLFAHDTRALNYLFFAIAIGYQPIAVDQLRRGRAMVRDGDGVGKGKALFML